MSVEFSADLDLSTPEKAGKALSDVVRAAKTLRDENGRLTGQVDAMVRDLKAANQRLTELSHQVSSGHAGAGEGEYSRFVVGDRVIMRGQVQGDAGWQDGLLDAGEPVSAWHEEFQRAVEEYSLTKIAIGRNPQRAARARLNAAIRSAPPSIKRVFGDSSGVGAEWIPDVMLPRLEMELKMERRVASLFSTLQMTNKNMLLPFLTTGLRPYLKGGATSDDPAAYTSSSLTTAQRSIDAVGFAVRAQVDEEAAEDSMIDAMPLFRQELISALVDGEEDAIINGDTAGTHQDSIALWNIRSRWGATGLGTATDHRKAWIGLRARAYDVSATTDQTAAQTAAGFLTARAALASPHGVAGALVAITSPEYFVVKMLGFSEVLTLEKFGNQATILTGQLASLLGVPVVLSEFVGADLATTGLFTNTGSTTGMILANRNRFILGERRGASIEVAKDITNGIHNLVATKREIFFTVDSSSKKNVHFSFNLSTS